MTDIEARAAKIVKTAASKLSPINYLSARVRTMERADVDELAIAYLFAQVKMRKRQIVAASERAAMDERSRRADPRNAAEQVESDRTRAEALAKSLQESQDRYIGKMKSMIDQFATELRMEWTNELLGSTFALGDGTEVTWGDATIAQHEQRYEMHRKNAIAGAEGAARHGNAIQLLTQTGAETLNDAVGAARHAQAAE